MQTPPELSIKRNSRESSPLWMLVHAISTSISSNSLVRLYRTRVWTLPCREELSSEPTLLCSHIKSLLLFLSSSYYEYNWQRNKGVSFSTLFQGMPISLQADISLSLYKGIIDQVHQLTVLTLYVHVYVWRIVYLQVPLFQNTEIGFTKLLALSIQPRLFLSKEYIVKKGDIGSEVGAIPQNSM